MKTITYFLSILLIIGASFGSIAQTVGDNDPTFNSNDEGFGIGDGPNNEVLTSVLQLDGKIIIGGSFERYNNIPRNKVARLNVDGTLDTSFGSTTTGSDVSYVATLALQSDGKVIVGGKFSAFEGYASENVVRLNMDGTIDSTFIIGTGASNDINSIGIQSDGKIILGGTFTTFNGVSHNRIVRLNTDGSIDNTFNSGAGLDGDVYSIKIQPDDKILAGGFFSSYNATSRNSMVRLNINGSIDNTFDVGSGVDSIVQTIELQPDDKIIIGGDFSSYNGIGRNHIARLGVDGALDMTFSVGTGFNANVHTNVIQPDGKILVGGDFVSYNGVGRNRLILLDVDGTMDASFNIGEGLDNCVNTVLVQPDGNIFIAGNFLSYNEKLINRVARIYSNGSLEEPFGIGMGASSEISTVSIQIDDKIIIGGYFTSYNGMTANHIARLNIDGELDATFNVGTGANDIVVTTAIQLDGKIIIGGDFTTYNGMTANHIARLNIDGGLDTTFNVGTGINGMVLTTAIQPDGKIIIGGDFTTYNGTDTNNVVRLNNDGSLDPTFNVEIGPYTFVQQIDVQSDGKIILFRGWNPPSGNYIQHMTRIYPDGSIDTSYNASPNGYVETTLMLPDDKFIIGGYFTSYNGIDKKHIARINVDGSLDTTFNVGAGPNLPVYSSVLQANGKIIIVGNLDKYDGITKNRIARLNVDGSLDNSFNGGLGPDNYSYCVMATQSTGRTVIGGAFTSYNGIGRNRIARVLNCEGMDANYLYVDNGNGNYSFTNISTGSFNQSHWAFGDGNTSTIGNPNHTFSANGTFVVVLTVNDSTMGNSCIDYYLDTIVVTGVPIPLQCVAGFVMYPDTVFNDVTIVNSSTGSNLAYFWEFGDGDTSTVQTPSHTYTGLDQSYLVCLTVDDGAGCVDMYCEDISVDGVVFGKSGFTINVIDVPLTTGIVSQLELNSQVRIYPNPTSTQLTIDSELKIEEVAIIGITGKTVKSIKPKSNVIDVSSLSNGIYFLKIIGEGKTIPRKFVKQ